MSDALDRVRKWDAAVGVDDAVARAVARAVAEERAAVVAYVRGLRAVAISDLVAAAIERGEHRREEEK